jgi:protein-L-isoaspartate(D-aspartate) O-methyltransferase
MRTKTYIDDRRAMVETQLRARGLRDARVLEAMAGVPRHIFVPEGLESRAYSDEPLPIGQGQTISQPYIVAYMTATLDLQGGEKALEVGTGSGYQTAVLASIVREVWTIEVVPALAERARTILDRLGFKNVRFLVGDGARGWPEEAPFDAIMVTAAPETVPPALEEQLAPGGRMMVPVGREFQELVLVRRGASGLTRERLLPVRFVPLVTES